MKKCLILSITSSWEPYANLMKVSMDTWDSVQQEGIETVFYCDGNKPNTDRVIYFNLSTDIFKAGYKTLAAFEWALKNKEWDYLCRPQANAYIHKKELIKHIQDIPDSNVFEAIECSGPPRWRWGVAYVFSRDVIQKMVDNKDKWNHGMMEDVALSDLADKLDVPYRNGKACSINKELDGSWLCLAYGSESFKFKDFSEINKGNGQFWYRCKQDHDRTQDEYVMRELFKHLK